LQVTVNVPDRLADEARARGLSVELYVEQVLTQRLQGAEQESDRTTVSEAIDRLIDLRKHNTLGDVKLKDLIHEGHKY
jgi:hypothetical protein